VYCSGSAQMVAVLKTLTMQVLSNALLLEALVANWLIYIPLCSRVNPGYEAQANDLYGSTYPFAKHINEGLIFLLLNT
jgi:hypothetical protein